MKKTKKKLNGINEQEFLTAIKNITTKLAYKFRFGYHDIEDMKQQATIFALESLDKYDKSRPLENFLWTHIRNRLFNFKRDNYQRPDKPCISCEHYDANKQYSVSECKLYSDKTCCDLYTCWFNRNNAKKNIMDTVNIDQIPLSSKNNDLKHDISNNEIVKILDENIPHQYREIYLKLKHGSKVNNSDRKILYDAINEILKNYDKNT